MTDKNKLEAIRKRIARLEEDEITGFEQTYSAIADVRSIIDLVPSTSLPAPTQDGTNYVQCTCRNGLEVSKNCRHGQEPDPRTQDGTAEEVIQELLDIEYPDDPQYANLESALISRKYCIQAMYNYSDPLRAEIERLKKEVEGTKIGASALINMKQAHIEAYQREITAANQRIKDLEEQLHNEKNRPYLT